MKKDIKEHKKSNTKAFVGVCISVLLILFAIYFTPDFVAYNLSSDGILEQITVFNINFIRIFFSILGTVALLSIAFKPKSFCLFYEKISKIPLIIKLLFLVDLALCLTHLLILLFVHHPFLIRLFDLGQEANIPTWYSSTKLFCISALAALFAYRKFDSAHITSWVLILLPILFLILSMDESASIHEWFGLETDFILLNTKREETFFRETGVWMFIAGVPFIIFFLTLMVSIKKYFGSKKYVFIKILFGMMIFLSGALGVEMAANIVENRFYIIFQDFCEELLEMVGITIIFWGFYQLTDFNWRKF
jgi:hypothetical protein